MGKFPKGGLIGKTVNAIEDFGKLNIPIHAASTGYFLVLSLFPSLLLLMSILRYTALEVETLIEVLYTILPDALMGIVTRLVNSCYQNSSGAVVGVSAVTALWSGSLGIHGLRRGLNAVYDVTEDRNYFHTRFISMVYTFLFLLVLILTLVLHVFGDILLDFFISLNIPLLGFLVELLDWRFFLLLAVQTLVFTLMYMALPNRRNRFLESLPGGVLASLGWLIFSDLFSMYVTYFDRYSNIYGSIYTIALGMLWLYICMIILLFGGALNHWLSGDRDA